MEEDEDIEVIELKSNNKRVKREKTEIEILEVYRWASVVLMVFITLIGFALIYLGYTRLYSVLTSSIGRFTALKGLGAAYGIILFFEIVFILVGIRFVWRFYKSGNGEMGAAMAFTSLALLHIFNLSYGLIILLFYESMNIKTPKNFIHDLTFWNGLSIGFIILIVLAIGVLGAGHARRQRIKSSR